MSDVFLLVLGSSIFVSLISLVGAVTLFIRKKSVEKLLFALVAFSAGALLGGAFFHLLPEALEQSAPNAVFLSLFAGFMLFFIMERFLRWRHCHDGKCEIHAFTYLSLVGDGIHNFIDGLAIGASYVADVRLGFATTFMIIAHEVPQELGDFGVLIYGGFSKAKALAYNFLTALTAVLGAILGYYLSNRLDYLIAFLLPFTAGGFIYVASSDLIPELHKEPDMKKSVGSFFLFLLGAGFILAMKMVAG